MKFFEFGEDDYNYLVKKCMLNEEYQKLLKMKIKEYSIIKMADELNTSEATISVMVRKLKKKINKVI